MTYWDDNATRAGVFNVGDMYDEYTARQAAFIVEQLDVFEGQLLDLGCGIGRLSGAVLDRLPNVDVEGYDTSRPMLEEASRIGARFTWLFGDLLSVAAPPYVGAWCVLTFQHLPDHTVKRHLADLFSILKPGARLVTQWVTSGEEGPMSYPRSPSRICDLHRNAGFAFRAGPRYRFEDVKRQFLHDSHVTGYADNWLWVTAEKPA